MYEVKIMFIVVGYTFFVDEALEHTTLEKIPCLYILILDFYIQLVKPRKKILEFP